MDQETDRDGPGMAAGQHPVARATYSDTRTVWLPDEWAVYIANGDDPESVDWPIELCDEELWRLRLEGFDVVTCTDRTRELGAYRGIAGTMRAYEALRIGGNDTVVRRVTLVKEHLELPAGESTYEVLLDVKLDLTRTESQPLERLVARAWRAGHGAHRRVALACGHVGDSGLERAWAHIDIDPAARPLARSAWSDGAAVRTSIEARNCVGQVVLKQPDAAIAETALPAAYRAAAFYDDEGQVRCVRCDRLKRMTVPDSEPPLRLGGPLECPNCERPWSRQPLPAASRTSPASQAGPHPPPPRPPRKETNDTC